MTASAQADYEIEIEDVEYIKHNGKPLLARLYKPRGKGPFPVVVDVHGGAWYKLDRTRHAAIDQPLARSGVVVAALDFRMAPEFKYPSSLADINFAIRWLKANAGQLNGRSDAVGILGGSSGGHLAMLAAMRPSDPRYGTLTLSGKTPVHATLRAVILCWPVIDPLARYHYAKKLKAAGNAKLGDSVLPGHEQYFAGEAEMAEANPTLALERRETVATPPVLYLQGTNDAAHPRPSLDQFVAGYRAAGGRVDLQLFEGVGEGFIAFNPDAPTSREALEKIIAFVHRELR